VRILLLVEWFDPEPTLTGLAFAKKLRDQGHDVEVLTAFPNYPGGRIYPGYAVRPMQVETMEGITVRRVALYPSHDRSSIRRILTYATFGLSSCFAGVFAVKRPDVIYANGPPPTVGVAAALIGLFRRVPFVFHTQDLWPDSLSAIGVMNNGTALRTVAAVCAWMHHRAAHIVVLAPGMRDVLISRGVPGEKVSAIYNWCVEPSLTQTAADAPQPRAESEAAASTFTVMFAGTMGRPQALDAVLDAAAILKDEHPRVRLSFMGGGIEVDRLKRQVKKRALDNVTFLPRVPMSEASAMLGQADALLVHLKDDPLFRITIPSKTQAYLHAGKPIVMAVAGDAAALVRAAGAGALAHPQDPRSIADAIGKLALLDRQELEEMGRRGRRYYMEHLSLEVGSVALTSVFQRTIDARATSQAHGGGR